MCGGRYLTVFVVALISCGGDCYKEDMSCAGYLFVNTSTHRLLDCYQRERYFHGVNVVVKGPPWMPSVEGQFDPLWSFVEEDMEILHENGLNGIRYGMMWPGVEPTRGKYNQTYIDAAVKMVTKAGAQYGIYTLLDMHQDVFSGKFCGEGVPDWAVETGSSRGFPWPLSAPYKVDPTTGYPTKEDCAKHNWASYQLTEAVGVAYQNLYNNTNGLRDSFARFWATVAENFANNPYIIGYDIMNEPWAGNVFGDPLLFIPKVADRKNLAAFYEAVHTELRKKDNHHNFFFESVTWDETGIGFESVPGGSAYANRSVISWHFYIPPMITHGEFFERQKDAERLACAGFLSEFWINDEKTMNYADEYLQSWLAWDYKGYMDITGSENDLWFKNGTRNEAAFDKISRTYAQVVSGVTTKMHYDPNTKEFTLEYYNQRFCTTNTTIIYLNEARHYSHGYDVSITLSPNEGGVSWHSPAKNYINVVHKLYTPEGMIINVNIKAKAKVN